MKPRRSQNTATTSVRRPSSTAVIARAVDELGHLRRQEPLELGDTLLALLRDGQLCGHGVEAVGQPLKLVAGSDLDAVVELTGTDALGALLEQTDRVPIIRRAKAKASRPAKAPPARRRPPVRHRAA